MGEAITFTYDRIDSQLYWKASKAACNPDDGGTRGWGWAMKIALWLATMIVIALLMQIPAIQRGGLAFVAGLAAGLVVMLLFLIGFVLINRRRLQRALAREQDRRGTVTAQLDAEGCHFTSSFGETRLAWRSIDTVIDLGTGTGLRSGLLVYPLPNAALPEGLAAAAFRARLEDWRAP
jgi:hypothetical protein